MYVIFSARNSDMYFSNVTEFHDCISAAGVEFKSFYAKSLA